MNIPTIVSEPVYLTRTKRYHLTSQMFIKVILIAVGRIHNRLMTTLAAFSHQSLLYVLHGNRLPWQVANRLLHFAHSRYL